MVHWLSNGHYRTRNNTNSPVRDLTWRSTLQLPQGALNPSGEGATSMRKPELATLMSIKCPHGRDILSSSVLKQKFLTVAFKNRNIFCGHII
jgi:hypothetical protein